MTGLISDEIRNIYADMYENGAERSVRAAGAVDKVANILRACAHGELPRRMHVVELGCGEGAIAEELVRRGVVDTYRGFDISRSGIEEAKGLALSDCHFEIFDGVNVPAADGAADLVILSHVVEHLEHPRTLLHEARRLAKWQVIEVPLELNSRTSKNYVLDDLGHINKYTARSIRHLVQSCGFVVEAQFTTNPGHALFENRSFRKLVNWHIKNVSLRVAPNLARSLFTFHETLLLSSESGISNTDVSTHNVAG